MISVTPEGIGINSDGPGEVVFKNDIGGTVYEFLPEGVIVTKFFLHGYFYTEISPFPVALTLYSVDSGRQAITSKEIFIGRNMVKGVGGYVTSDKGPVVFIVGIVKIIDEIISK